jgi:hypothetical protein
MTKTVKFNFVLLAFAARKQAQTARKTFWKCNSKTGTGDRIGFIIRTESKSSEFWIFRTLPLNIKSIFSSGLKAVLCRLADPQNFNADPDPAFHFNADPDQTSKSSADPHS